MSARFGLIDAVKQCDTGIREAVATIIWAAPHLSSEIQEFTQIAKLFELRYGKEFAQACLDNLPRGDGSSVGWVSDNVIQKLQVHQPKPELVDDYLMGIAGTYKIPYTPPDRRAVSLRGGVPSLIDMSDYTPGGYGDPSASTGGNRGSGSVADLFPGVPVAGGGDVWDPARNAGAMYPPEQKIDVPLYPPERPASSGATNAGGYGGGGDPSLLAQAFPSMPSVGASYVDKPPFGADSAASLFPDPFPQAAQPLPQAQEPRASTELPMVPSSGGGNAGAMGIPPPGFAEATAPEQPSQPLGGSSSGPEIPDFDELTRRFQNLKNKRG